MRRLLGYAIVIVLFAALDRTGATEWKASPTTAAQAKTPDAAATVPPAATPVFVDSATDCDGASGCGNSCGRNCRSGCGCLHRLADWLSYRAAPAPRECRCRHTCAGCTPPLYSYFAVRYPAHGHVDFAHPPEHAAPSRVRPPRTLPPLPQE